MKKTFILDFTVCVENKTNEKYCHIKLLNKILIHFILIVNIIFIFSESRKLSCQFTIYHPTSIFFTTYTHVSFCRSVEGTVEWNPTLKELNQYS